MLSFNKKILNPNQLGFQPSLKCADAVKELTEEIRTVMEIKSSGHLCLLDLKKAFNTIDHQFFKNLDT